MRMLYAVHFVAMVRTVDGARADGCFDGGALLREVL